MKDDRTLRNELLGLLDGGNAHMDFEEVIADFPMDHINSRPPNTPYTFWHFVEHIRIAQWDILEFIRDPNHVSPEYPQGYRPAVDETTDAAGWQRSVRGILHDLGALRHLVQSPEIDLFAPLPHAPSYNIMREILVAADHNAYHIGELAIMRQVAGLWPSHKPYLTGRPD